MLVHIHSEKDRWALIKAEINPSVTAPRPYLPEEADNVGKALILAKAGYDAASVYTISKGVAPWNIDRETLERQVNYERSTAEIAKGFEAVMPTGAGGSRYREQAGKYIFDNRHKIAGAILESEALSLSNHFRTNYVSGIPRLERHERNVNHILSSIWEATGQTESPPFVTKHQMSGRQIRQAAQGMIMYEKALGLVMPNAYKEYFDLMPHERHPQLPNSQNSLALVNRNADARARAVREKAAISEELIPTDKARRPEMLEDRWLRKNTQDALKGRRDNSPFNIPHNPASGLLCERQENHIKNQKGNPVVTGWTRQGTLEVGRYDQNTNAFQYNHVHQLELRTPVDIHDDGKGGLKIVSRIKLRPDTDGEKLHPILKEVLEPTLALNQPAHDHMLKMRSLVFENRKAIIAEMDWANEIDELSSFGPGTTTHKTLRSLNALNYKNAVSRGITPDDQIFPGDLIFAARVAEAKTNGIAHPVVADWSVEETKLRPVSLALRPNLHFDEQPPSRAIPRSIIEGLAAARRQVPAGEANLENVAAGKSIEPLKKARSEIAKRYQRAPSMQSGIEAKQGGPGDQTPSLRGAKRPMEAEAINRIDATPKRTKLENPISDREMNAAYDAAKTVHADRFERHAVRQERNRDRAASR